MGYLVNTLPRFLALHGAEVHVFAGDLPFAYQSTEYASVYGGTRLDGALAPGVYPDYDGYTLHIFPHRFVGGHVRLTGLRRALIACRPDVVQVYQSGGWITLECAMLKPLLGYAFFTGNHNAASTFPLWPLRHRPFARARVTSFFTRHLPGRFASVMSEKCYAATVDCGEIAWRFLGAQRAKVEVMHLGVDTSLFHLPDVSEKAAALQLRARLGIAENETVFVYSGKLTAEKNALIVARTVAAMRADGLPVRALVVGDGPQRDAITACDGAIVHSFVRFSELPVFYWAADVGVWPTNESTSMLDAAACGLPLIVSDGIVYREHVNGNGVVVRCHNREDLRAAMTQLLDGDVRSRLGLAGADKMRRDFSMDRVAQRRLTDYGHALAKQGRQS